MKVVQFQTLGFLSAAAAATTWCGRAEQEEAPLEGLDVKIRSEILESQVRRHNLLLPVSWFVWRS